MRRWLVEFWSSKPAWELHAAGSLAAWKPILILVLFPICPFHCLASFSKEISHFGSRLWDESLGQAGRQGVLMAQVQPTFWPIISLPHQAAPRRWMELTLGQPGQPVRLELGDSMHGKRLCGNESAGLSSSRSAVSCPPSHNASTPAIFAP